MDIIEVFPVELTDGCVIKKLGGLRDLGLKKVT